MTALPVVTIESVRYRYTLSRQGWLADNDFVMPIIGLNPSKATHTVNDPTTIRCVRFTQREGCGKLLLVNIFALVATDPQDMIRALDPVGPRNDQVLEEVFTTHPWVVAAWGANAHHPVVRARTVRVLEMAKQAGCELKCLGLTKDGHPRHPLMVRSDQPLIALPSHET